MKKQFSELSQSEQEQIESDYHGMKPEDFDEQMMQAKHHLLDTTSFAPLVDVTYYQTDPPPPPTDK